MHYFKSAVLGLGLSLGLTTSAVQAATFNFTIGDDDGFGVGIPDGTSAAGFGIKDFPFDARSAFEKTASDGSEQTDINSILFNPLPTTANFMFTGFGGPVTAATLTLDIGGLQYITFGETLASFNGILQAGLLAIEEGRFEDTRILKFNLDSATLDSINTSGFFSFGLNRNNNTDAIFIDYVALSGDISPVPLPATGLLLLGALAGAAGLRRRSKA